MEISDSTLSKNQPSVLFSLPWLLGWISLTVMGPLVMAKVIYKTMQVVLSHFLDKEKELQGKTVLITGASSGIGKSLAHSLYKRGCRLILASRNVLALELLKSTLIQTYSPPELHLPSVVALDLEDMNSIPGIVDKMIKDFGHIDILINNAGMSYRGDIATTDISVHVKLMVVNYLGQVALTKSILKNMMQRKSGHIVAISSLQGRFALPFRSSYSASKHALQSFFDSLRAEVVHKNIHVTVISPGYIKTNLSYNSITGSGDVYGVMDAAQETGMSPDDVSERVVKCLITKEEEVTIAPFHHRFMIFVRHCVPSLYFYIMNKRSLETIKSLKDKEC